MMMVLLLVNLIWSAVVLLLLNDRSRLKQILELYQTQALLDRGQIARLEAENESNKWKEKNE